MCIEGKGEECKEVRDRGKEGSVRGGGGGGQVREGLGRVGGIGVLTGEVSSR